MTPFELDCAREDRDRQQAEIAEDYYLEGCSDAGYGQLPRYADDVYLSGYIVTLKTLPTDDNGRIRHYSPRQHFAFGFMDTPDDCHCDEF
jgi:hypothetical protein